MSDHLTEEEQLEALKRWWKENRLWVVTAVVLAVGGYFGWGAWQDHQRAQAQAASKVYTNLLDTLAVRESGQPGPEDRTRAEALVTELKTDYSGSGYAINAALIHAGAAVKADDLDTAEQELRWVLEQKPEAPVAEIARLRLSRVLLARGDAEAALAELSGQPEVEILKADYAELRGDSHLALGDIQSARQAYEEALNSLGAQQQNRYTLLRSKLNNLPTDGSETLAGPGENAS